MTPEIPLPERTRESPDVRREQLLAATRDLLTASGMPALTMAEVARVAGVAKGTTYLYFPSKNDLIAALRDRYLDDYARALHADDSEQPLAPTERLDAFIDGLLRFANDHHALHHALFHDAGVSGADLMRGARDLLELIVADEAADGSFDITDADIAPTAAFVLHGTHGALVDTLHATHRPTAGEPAESVSTEALRSAITSATNIAHRTVGAT